MIHTNVYIYTTTQPFSSAHTCRYIRDTNIYPHTIHINMHIPISAHAYNDAQIYTVNTVSGERAFAALHATSAHRTLAVKQVQDLGGARNWGEWRVSVSVNFSDK